MPPKESSNGGRRPRLLPKRPLRRNSQNNGQWYFMCASCLYSMEGLANVAIPIAGFFGQKLPKEISNELCMPIVAPHWKRDGRLGEVGAPPAIRARLFFLAPIHFRGVGTGGFTSMSDL